jgi:alpha-galactosidase
MAKWSTVAEVRLTAQSRVFEHGWQSWTPARNYVVGERPHRPVSVSSRMVNWRGDSDYSDAFQSDGVMAVTPEPGGEVHMFAARDAREQVPRIRAHSMGGVLRVEADGSVAHDVDPGAGGVQGALSRWAEGFAFAMDAGPLRPVPTLWCSWYHYGTEVTEADILENAREAQERELGVDVIQIDDGYQAGYGDWLVDSDRFGSMRDLVARITELGFIAGIWTAPLLVGAASRLAAEHPDWLVADSCGQPVSAGFNWGQALYALDATHPGAGDYLRQVYSTLADWGVGFHKLDFLYAGSLPGCRYAEVTGVQAYRHGLELIRDVLGEARLLGCGAPLLPSVGLVDAMRVSCDTGANWEPGDGDLGAPSMRGAIQSGRARAFTQGRFWSNDTDCLLARPGLQWRDRWAAHVDRFGGARGSSDRLADLDEWGEDVTREILAGSTTKPFGA